MAYCKVFPLSDTSTMPPPRVLHRLLDGGWHLTGFATTESNPTFPIAHYRQGGETKLPPTFDYFRNSINSHQFLEEIVVAGISLKIRHRLKLQSTLTGRIGKRLDSAVKLETRTIERNPHNSGALCALRDYFADHLGCSYVAAILNFFSNVFIEGRRAGNHSSVVRAKDLHINVSGGAMDGQTRYPETHDSRSRFPGPSYSRAFLVHSYPYAFFASFRLTFSSEYLTPLPLYGSGGRNARISAAV